MAFFFWYRSFSTLESPTPKPLKSLATLFACLFACFCIAQHGTQHSAAAVQGVGYSPNHGQFPEQVKAFTPFAGGYLFAEADRLTFSLFSRVAHGSAEETVKHHVYSQRFVGAHAVSFEPSEQGAFSWTRNFFLGADANRWRGSVAAYVSGELKELYQGIGLELTSEYGNLKTNFHVAPGADPDQILWAYEGANARLVNGHLEVATSAGDMLEMKPVAWTVDANGEKERVSVRYVQKDGGFAFDLETYDTSKKLVIDPVLVFSSYSGSTADNWGFTATFDAAGSAYGGGIVNSAGYPVSTGVVQQTHGGGNWDVAITKFVPDGSDIVYATYLGGSGNEIPSSLVVDSQNRLVVFGATGSENFPVTDGCYDGSHNGGSFTAPLGTIDFANGSDMYVARFSNDGAAMDACTYVGGDGNDGLNEDFNFNYGDLFRAEVVVDGSNRIICAGTTTSTDFPTAGTPFSDAGMGGQDGVVFMLSEDLTALEWATYFGGILDDTAYALEYMSDGSVYVVGSTQSPDLPVTEGALFNDFQGEIDGYLTHIDNGEVLACTFIGTDLYDRTLFVEQDTDGNIWITGQTEGDFPVVNNTYIEEGGGQYFAKLSPDLNTLLLSTTYGAPGVFSNINICQTAFLVDNCNRIFVSGWGGALNFTFGDTENMALTADAFQSATDGSDFYVAAFDVDVSGLLYGSYIGGDGVSEHVDGGTSRFSPDGTVYQAVCAGCGGSNLFPFTDGAYSEDNNSTNCNLAVFKFDFEITSLTAVANAEPSSVGCAPFEVDFSSSGSTGIESFWDFDTGETSTENNPTYTFVSPGSYNVMYVSTDQGSCNVSDTTYISVEVGDPLDLQPDFTWDTALCQDTAWVGVTYTGGGEYDELWFDFGDGSGSVFDDELVYIYDTPGTYTITAFVNDLECDAVLSTSLEVSVESEGGLQGTVKWPNIITPNDDAMNRLFKPMLELASGSLLVPDETGVAEWFTYLHVEVYNRWGNLVFESSDATPFWDASEAADGVYYFIGSHQLSCTETETTTVSSYVHVVR